MKKTLNIQGRLVDLSTPKVMGIINLTPDSFYSKSRAFGHKKQFEKMIDGMIADEVDMIDVGGYSTRPGADDISDEEEVSRVLTAISWIAKTYPDVIVCIDTFRSKVARAAVGEGATMINDISGGLLDAKMPQTVADLKVPYILMHTRGTPVTMQSQAVYGDVVLDVMGELQQRVALFEEKNVKDIVIDVGFGFAKNTRQNFTLLNSLDYFQLLKKPILAGVSRKSMIYKTLDVTAEDALNGTTAINMIALEKGVSILRVHDVRAAKEATKLFNALTAC